MSYTHKKRFISMAWFLSNVRHLQSRLIPGRQTLKKKVMHVRNFKCQDNHLEHESKVHKVHIVRPFITVMVINRGIYKTRLYSKLSFFQVFSPSFPKKCSEAKRFLLVRKSTNWWGQDCSAARPDVKTMTHASEVKKSWKIWKTVTFIAFSDFKIEIQAKY